MRKEWFFLTLGIGFFTLLWLPHSSEARRNMYGGRIGSIVYSFDSINGVGRRIRQAKIYYFHKKRCQVVGLYGRNRRLFRRAAAFANYVVTHPDFAKVLYAKGRFLRTRDSARTILYKLQRRRTKVVVNTFQRTRKFPCYTDSANGHTNAFARLGTKILFIYRPYLYRKGRYVRALAKTIVHETLHTLGYSHRGYRAWGRQYNNTVPPFVGCVIRNWPTRRRLSRRQQRGLAYYCSLSSRSQKNYRTKRRYIPWMR